MLNCELEWYEEQALREDAYMRAYFEDAEDAEDVEPEDGWGDFEDEWPDLEEDDEPDFVDDVDETFYDPYMGCNWYE